MKNPRMGLRGLGLSVFAKDVNGARPWPQQGMKTGTAINASRSTTESARACNTPSRPCLQCGLGCTAHPRPIPNFVD
jgi:hypothetical protein